VAVSVSDGIEVDVATVLKSAVGVMDDTTVNVEVGGSSTKILVEGRSGAGVVVEVKGITPSGVGVWY
jgi:hypothetical protein